MFPPLFLFRDPDGFPRLKSLDQEVYNRPLCFPFPALIPIRSYVIIERKAGHEPDGKRARRKAENAKGARE